MPIEQLPAYPAKLWQYKSLLRSIGKNVHFSDKQHLIKNLKMVHDQYQKKYDFMMDWRIWCDAYEGAQKRLAARQAKLPKIDYPALPISDHADKLCKLIRTNRVVVIAGETGSGKTTQIHFRKQLCYLPCLLYTSPSPRDLSTSRMPSSA